MQLDDEKAEAAKKQEEDDVDSMLDPAILEAFIAQRMQEMMLQSNVNT